MWLGFGVITITIIPWWDDIFLIQRSNVVFSFWYLNFNHHFMDDCFIEIYVSPFSVSGHLLSMQEVMWFSIVSSMICKSVSSIDASYVVGHTFVRGSSFFLEISLSFNSLVLLNPMKILAETPGYGTSTCKVTICQADASFSFWSVRINCIPVQLPVVRQ